RYSILGLLLIRVAALACYSLIYWNSFGGGSNWAARVLGYYQAFVTGPADMILPLLAIVWSGWRHHDSGIADDGSRWPRRYCGRCFYNLHGLEPDRCPECGMLLAGRTSEQGSLDHIAT